MVAEDGHLLVAAVIGRLLLVDGGLGTQHKLAQKPVQRNRGVERTEHLDAEPIHEVPEALIQV